MSQPTQFIYLSGKCKYARVFRPDIDYKKWSILLYPNDEGKQIVEGLLKRGIKNRWKKDEDGECMTFSRPMEMDRKGRLTAMEAPLVLEADGKTPMTDKLIGDGSDVTLKLEVYGFNKFPGCAARLATVRVDNLVEYVPQRDMTQSEKDMARGVDEQPAPKQVELF